MAYESWSHDGKHLFFETFPAKGNLPHHPSSNERSKDRGDSGFDEIMACKRHIRGVRLVGLGPDDSPMVTRDISAQEIYALEMEWP